MARINPFLNPLLSIKGVHSLKGLNFLEIMLEYRSSKERVVLLLFDYYTLNFFELFCLILRKV